MADSSINRLKRLTELGQSLWMDNIRRGALEDGETKALIDRGDIRGMTSNPTIFSQAITGSRDYDEALRSLAWSGWDTEKIFWELVVEDVRSALDLFAPLYEQTNGADGYVSIEVSPKLSDDTEATIAQTQQLWARVARPNLMVKIPATTAGIPAIQRGIAAGMNINITLIFSRRRYAEVMEAYLAGLEERVAAGRSIEHIASVASFFVSRVDTKIDKRLPPDSPLRGKAAIANAKLAYEDFQNTFKGERWERLREHGARLQRPLWASTSTKDPAYRDTIYVDELVGADTVNTMPPKTLDAVRDHGRVQISITQGLDQAREDIAAIERAGISMDQATSELEVEGIKTFSASVDELVQNIDRRRQEALAQLGPIAAAVSQRMDSLSAESVLARLCAKDPTLWTQDPAGQAEASRRLGWLDSPQKALAVLPQYESFAAEIHRLGIFRYLVVGMGGSSLAAEVFGRVFASPGQSDSGSGTLGILDSTDPAQVQKAAQEFPPDRSLYIISSKSGGTAEVTSGFEYLWLRARGDGSRFIAISDEGTSLQQLAQRLGFRRTFVADKTVGGRYAALTDFALVPAALLGVDLRRLLASAEWMQAQCQRDVPAARSPGVVLGAILGAAALAGRDKLTILADDSLEPLTEWIEQLVAESSGKSGKGILPVVLEPLDAPSVYGQDRFFMYVRQDGASDAGIEALSRAGFPVVTLDVPDNFHLGAEFVRWEVAVAVACHILGVNAFDQPDVQESKDRTQAGIESYRAGKALNQGKWDIDLRGTAANKSTAEDRATLLGFLEQGEPGSYVAINAYLPREPVVQIELQRLRVMIREKTHLAVTAGFGPRFQHSTGQYHKGGPNTGLFLQIVSDPASDMEVPGQGITFGTLIRAQALGDFETLRARGRRVLRVHLSSPDQIRFLRRLLQ